MGFFRPTFAQIDLGALASNYKAAKALLPKDAEIMAMVKADAYGHGAKEVSRRLEDEGVAGLGVATVEEGIELREAGLKSPIIVIGGLMGMGSPASGMMVAANLTPVVHSIEVIEFLESVSKAAQRTMGIHLKVDTGMTRLGAMPSWLAKILNKLAECKHIKLEGVMTHFAEAEDSEYTARQMNSFESVAKQIEEKFDDIKIWHCANSAALIDKDFVVVRKNAKTWVRPGIMLYGSYPAEIYKEKIELRPVMSLKSAVALIKTVDSGTPVSYNRTYTTDKKTRVGVVPIGYADGYPWSLSNRGSVLIRGKRVPVIGRVTMDMIMVDITGLDFHVGDEVVLLGSQNGEKITAEELSDLSGTISYELFCRISKRMPRVYV